MNITHIKFSANCLKSSTHGEALIINLELYHKVKLRANVSISCQPRSYFLEFYSKLKLLYIHYALARSKMFLSLLNR
jgi:hypothetical protein